MSPSLVLLMYGNKLAGFGVWIARASSAVLPRAPSMGIVTAPSRAPSYEMAQREIYFAAMPFPRWKQ